MNKKPDIAKTIGNANTEVVRKALAQLESVHREAWGLRPKLDAWVAVLRGELRDRLAGRTYPNEKTPGLKLARRVRV